MNSIRRPRRRVDGVVILDKPAGLSSNAALQRVRGFFRAEKAGHTGALDPLATGVLPVCLGEATKFSSHLLDADKAYAFDVLMGQRTATGDAEGAVVEEADWSHVDAALLERTLEGFRGGGEQVPTMYSALKFQGQPLYRLARQGIEVERQARAIEIYSLQLVHFSGNAFKLYVRCSKGTYVRTLAEDICRAMGTVGHVTALRRTQAGPFSLDAAHTLESLAARLAEGGESAMDMLLLPASVGVAHWPAISLDELGMARVLQGQSVLTSGQREGAVRLIGPDEKFLGVGDVMADGRVQPRRLLRVP